MLKSVAAFIGKAVQNSTQMIRLPLVLLISGISLLKLHGEDAVAVDKIADKVRPSVLTVINAGRDGYAQGLGTGFVISKDGLVVTNLHVVGEARPINVELQDGRRPRVTEVLGWSRKDDLIIFRIDVSDIPPLELGPPEKMPQGSAVVAMGNPLGLRYSVVSAVVSGVREVEGQELIQLAMPIESGNSGGPLVDVEGKLRGIVNMKSAVSENLGYAIPVSVLRSLLANPAPVKIENWLTIGRLNPRVWKSTDASWTQRAGHILVHGIGEGFGGRALCVHQPMPPELPYEVSVRVKLDDESGAAGLAFCSEGADTHYGFYPTAGKLRLTRFEGPDISNWTILQDVESSHLKKGDWNQLLVRVEADSLHCFLNGHEVITSSDPHLRTGRAGLCKFRQTEPQFKDFRLGKVVSAGLNDTVATDLQQMVKKVGNGEAKPDTSLEKLATHPETSRDLIEGELRAMETRAADLRKLSQRIHESEVLGMMDKVLSKPTDKDINLGEAALLISRLDNPELDVSGYLAELDGLATEVKAVLTPEEQTNALKRTERLVKWMFQENGFHGSKDDYYSKSNSYLNEVIDDREGLPITLSVLFMELGWRLDLPLVGIPVPGHFVVQYRPMNDTEDPVTFDPFDGGKRLTSTELLAISKDERLVPASKRQIVVRMLRNLIGIQLDEKSDLTLPYLNMLLAVSPEESGERLSRAVLLYQAGQKKEAKEDIQWLVTKKPEGIDIERLQQWLDKISE